MSRVLEKMLRGPELTMIMLTRAAPSKMLGMKIGARTASPCITQPSGRLKEEKPSVEPGNGHPVGRESLVNSAASVDGPLTTDCFLDNLACSASYGSV